MLVGFAIGRWWSVLAAVAFGVSVGAVSEVEVSPFVLGVGYGLSAAAGICAGVAARQKFRSRRAS